VKEFMTKEEILQAIKDCAAELGRAPSITELLKMSQVHRARAERPNKFRKFSKGGTSS
jgi:hypothetical protein